MFKLNSVTQITLIFSCSLVIFGCASTDKQQMANNEDSNTSLTNGVESGRINNNGITTITTPNGATVNLPKELTNPDSKLSERSIFFALDSYQINENGQTLVNAHSIYLSKNKQFNVQLHGHADERGSSEYNLALGQKRAETVKKGLQLLGIDEGRLEAVSFGKEKPRNPGHDEMAWAENRRVDIKYDGEN